MVFPYMDHDLSGLLENQNVKLTLSQIKLYMLQLCEGVGYLHRVRWSTTFSDSAARSQVSLAMRLGHISF